MRNINSNYKRAEVVVLTFDEIEIERKIISRENEKQFTMVNGQLIRNK